MIYDIYVLKQWSSQDRVQVWLVEERPRWYWPRKRFSDFSRGLGLRGTVHQQGRMQHRGSEP
jgi:hypothetical protein